jgi:peptidoglycan/LPS O-acetylase OafA/YrhL
LSLAPLAPPHTDVRREEVASEQRSGQEAIFEARPSESKHLGGLDGLRGIAILSVIVFHTLSSAPQQSLLEKIVVHLGSLGWMGVDLFFVLSGFLITGILIDQRLRPRYFRTFFARRVLRIVPAYAAFLIFMMFIAPLVGAVETIDALRLRDLQLWYWSYLVNIYIALHGWAAAAGGTTHLWSLAIEEQFYLLWPVAVLILSPRALARLALACIVMAECVRLGLVLIGAPREVSYVLLPARFDTLAFGALLACAMRSPELLAKIYSYRALVLRTSLAALSIVLMVKHTLDFQQPLTQLIGYSAIAAMSGWLVLYAIGSHGWLTMRPLRFIGKYSYAMYIWHSLVIAVVAKTSSFGGLKVNWASSLPSYGLFVAVVIVGTIGVALLSWTLIEKPFLRMKRFVPYA